MRARDGKRQSVFRSYSFPLMDRPNLTVLPHALVTRLTFDHKRATGVEIFYDGQTRSISADLEVVLSLGAINTPKVLMQQVSVIKPNCSTSGSRSSNIYRASGITFKTILLLAAFGSLRSRCRRRRSPAWSCSGGASQT